MQDPDMQGGLIAGRFQVVRELEAGGGGGRVFVVRMEKDDTGALFVMKHFDPSGGRLHAILREKQSVDTLIERGQQLGLVVDHGVGESEFWYTMPFHEGPNLHDWTVRESRKAAQGSGRGDHHLETLGLLCGILRQVEVLHAHGLAHRDIKPGNVIVTADGPQLIDFGLLTAVGSAALLTTSGTPHYKDPRMDSLRLRALRVADVDPKAFDVYSLGALLYFLFEVDHPVDGGLSPFSARTPLAVQHVFRVATARHGERYPDVAAMLADVEFLRDAAAKGRLDSLSPLALPGMAKGLALNGTGNPERVAEASSRRSVVAVAGRAPWPRDGRGQDAFAATGVAEASSPPISQRLRQPPRRLLAAAAVLLLVALVGGIMAMTGGPAGDESATSGTDQRIQAPAPGDEGQPQPELSVLLDEDFESYELGSWPTGWIADANAADQPSKNRVVADPEDPSNKVLQLYGVNENPDPWGALAYYPVPLGETFTISFRVWNGDEPLRSLTRSRAGLSLHSGPSWSSFACPVADVLEFSDSGYIRLFGGNALSYYDTGRWYDMILALQIDGQRLDGVLTVDGRVVMRKSEQWPDNRLQHLSHLGVQALSGTAMFDNVSILGSSERASFTQLRPSVMSEDFEEHGIGNWPEDWTKIQSGELSDHWNFSGVVHKPQSESLKALSLHSPGHESPVVAACHVEVPERFTLSVWVLPVSDPKLTWNGQVSIGLRCCHHTSKPAAPEGQIDSTSEPDGTGSGTSAGPLDDAAVLWLVTLNPAGKAVDCLGETICKVKNDKWHLIEVKGEISAGTLRLNYATAGMLRGSDRVMTIPEGAGVSLTALTLRVSAGTILIDSVSIR